MKNVLILCMTAVVAFVLVGSSPVASFGQCPCVVICPAGDGVSSPGPPGGTKSPDLDGDGDVDLIDFALFATGYPPNPYMFCADYDCNGIVNLIDFSIFAMHYLHIGPIRGYNAPAIDHYKTYETFGPAFQGPIFLRDQFGEVPVTSLFLSKFATPVSKNGEQVCDTLAHQSWWEFLEPQPMRMVTAQDQFGTSDWVLFDARYLLLPALKNEGVGQPLPKYNHYLCYEAQGPTLALQVRLIDQFDRVDVVILEGRYFCNPCEKETPDGLVYPIIDPLAHLTVYFVQNPKPYQIPVLMADQFFEGTLVLFENLFLAVPALKTAVIQQNSSEWNRIKALYDIEQPRIE